MDERFRKAIALCDAARASYEAGDYRKARRLYRRAGSCFARAAVPEDERRTNLAAVWLNLGACAYALSMDAEASDCYRHAAELYRRLGDWSGLALALNNLGAVLVRMGRFSEAGRSLQGCLRIDEQLGNEGGLAAVWHNLGRLAEAQGTFEKARSCYRRSLELFRALGWDADVQRETAALQRLSGQATRTVPEEGEPSEGP